jgi:hypothetical protein
MPLRKFHDFSISVYQHWAHTLENTCTRTHTHAHTHTHTYLHTTTHTHTRQNTCTSTHTHAHMPHNLRWTKKTENGVLVYLRRPFGRGAQSVCARTCVCMLDNINCKSCVFHVQQFQSISIEGMQTSRQDCPGDSVAQHDHWSLWYRNAHK